MLCEQLLEWLNSLLPGVIKFKFEFSTDKIEFLDLEIFIQNGRIETNLYIKPTNLQQYLDYNYNHPESCKQGLVYGQALRIVERCSKSEDAETHLEKFKSKLKERNYPESVIDNKISEARKVNRGDLIL